MKRIIKHLPIFSGLADCQIQHHVAASKQFASDLIFSTLPLWVGALVILLTSGQQAGALKAFTDTFSRGELFIYCTATLGPIIYISNKEFKSGPFPGRHSLHVAVIVILIICGMAYSLQRANVNLNSGLAFRLSILAYGISLALYYLTIVYDIARLTGAPAVFKAQTDDFVAEFNERHQSGT